MTDYCQYYVLFSFWEFRTILIKLKHQVENNEKLSEE